jgi:hypothetical protein
VRQMRRSSPLLSTRVAPQGPIPTGASQPVKVASHEHRSFTISVPVETPIWRYMDFTTFVSLLSKKALFFSRVDVLEDKFEGSLPRPNFEMKELEPGRINHEERLPPEEVARLRKEYPRFQRVSLRRARARTLVNCWYVGAHESAAMWGLYAGRSAGIAVRSTVSRLIRGLDAPSSPITAYFGMVSYVDYETHRLTGRNLMEAFLIKRMNYEHERELRVVLTTEQPVPGGAYVAVDLPVLIDEVRVTPTAPVWMAETVQDVMSRYKLKRTVQQSSLGGSPLV